MAEVTIREVEQIIGRWAPLDTAVPGDPVGHQVGDRDRVLQAVAVALDASPTQVERAANEGCELLVSHHPLIYRPLSRIDPSDPVGRSVSLLCRHEMALYVAHTNWDVAPGGVNDALASAIGLQNVHSFAAHGARRFIKFVTFVPRPDVQRVLDALSIAGAGQIGLYRRCAFFHLGTGTFEPLPGANPAIGEVGMREEVEEYRLETVAPEAVEGELVRALRASHPYEEPAFDILPVRSGPETFLGRIGDLPAPQTPTEFLASVSQRLTCTPRWLGAAKERVGRIAVVGGSGGDFVGEAAAAGADALLTGELRHHQIVEAYERGLGIVDATHAATEQPGVEALAKRLESHFAGRVRVQCFSPSE
ncbi:MAG: Nif3-like dinuclear metal center hexameric protein [Fimbriimonadia bacterium]|jgi:dinuclear metal center YbgI/SA1388 family protein